MLKHSKDRWNLRFNSYIELNTSKAKVALKGCGGTCKYLGVVLDPIGDTQLFPPGGPAAGCWGKQLTDEQIAKSDHAVLGNASERLNETVLSLKEEAPTRLPRSTVDVVGLNFRNVRLPRGARVQQSYLRLLGASGGADLVGTADHVATQISAVANCAEAARGPDAASNWSFPTSLVKLCRDDCAVFDEAFGVNQSFIEDGFCDDGGENSDFAACAYGSDCHDCPFRGWSAPGLGTWPLGKKSTSASADQSPSVEWHPMDWNVEHYDDSARKSPNLASLLQSLVEQPDWPIEGGCQVTLLLTRQSGPGDRRFPAAEQQPGSARLEFSHRPPDEVTQLEWAEVRRS